MLLLWEILLQFSKKQFEVLDNIAYNVTKYINIRGILLCFQIGPKNSLRLSHFIAKGSKPTEKIIRLQPCSHFFESKENGGDVFKEISL